MHNLFAKNKILYLITDRSVSCHPPIETTEKAIEAGIRMVQLREKGMTKKEIYEEALLMRKLTYKHRVTFMVNDYVDIARAVNADGVHLGQDDIPLNDARKIMKKNNIIGISTHTIEQAITAQDEGADYIGFGPVFQTSTKDAGSPQGLNKLKEVRRYVHIPIVAIGGISPENIISVLDAGADAVAVMSAILRGDIKKNVEQFLLTIKMKR